MQQQWSPAKSPSNPSAWLLRWLPLSGSPEPPVHLWRESRLADHKPCTLQSAGDSRHDQSWRSLICPCIPTMIECYFRFFFWQRDEKMWISHKSEQNSVIWIFFSFESSTVDIICYCRCCFKRNGTPGVATGKTFKDLYCWSHPESLVSFSPYPFWSINWRLIHWLKRQLLPCAIAPASKTRDKTQDEKDFDENLVTAMQVICINQTCPWAKWQRS